MLFRSVLLPLLRDFLGLGADSAVLKSLSLRSPSAKSSASSELTFSKPANKLLMRGGRLSPLSVERGPSSLLPGYESCVSAAIGGAGGGRIGTGGDEGGSPMLWLLFFRRGLRGGGTTPGVKKPAGWADGSGDGGHDDIDEGCRCRGSKFNRLSTLISSVCTETELYGAATRMETWHATSLKYCGSSDSLGVAGLDVGGCIEIDGKIGRAHV